MQVIGYDKIDRVEWSAFVHNHSQGNVFQTPEMYDVFALSDHILPIVVAATINNQIVGILLAQYITNGNKWASYFTARSIIIGGPLVCNNDSGVMKAILNAYKKQLPNQTIYSEIRPIYDIGAINVSLKSLGWIRKGHYNMQMALDKSQDALFEQMHKERKRNVKQAINAGLVFREVTKKEDVHAIVMLIQQTYKRKHVPISYLDMFEKVRQLLKPYAHFFACYGPEGKMIAGEVRLCYKDLVYAWFAGSDEHYLKLRPNDFTMWSVICWSLQHGYKLLDFGGGGEPGVPYGVRDYKLKYGCQMFDYGRYVYVHRPISLWAGTLAYKIYHKLKGK